MNETKIGFIHILYNVEGCIIVIGKIKDSVLPFQEEGWALAVCTEAPLAPPFPKVCHLLLNCPCLVCNKRQQWHFSETKINLGTRKSI